MNNIQDTSQIAVVGLGLIGGSIAKRLNLNGFKVVGFDPDLKTVQTAINESVLSAGAVWPKLSAVSNEDEKFFKEDSAKEESNFFVYNEAWQKLENCTAVFICTPPEYVACAVAYVRRFSDAVITDVASVKKPVMETVFDRRFVGGHPMAGSEKNGYTYSSDSLLENAVYVLCIPENCDLSLKEYNTLIKIISLTGASILELDYKTHDKAVAAISHLPHAAASALSLLVAQQGDDSLSRLAAGGFRDITRIASSSPQLWAAICIQSGAPLSDLLGQYIDLLSEFRDGLKDKDKKKLEKFFFQAAQFRNSLPVDGRGALNAQSSLTVYVKDRPGELGRITTLLGENEININNIRIKEFRDYEGGCLQILLPDSSQSVKATWLLKEAGYECD